MVKKVDNNKIALGILIVCGVSLVVGLTQTILPQITKAREAHATKPGLSAVLGPTALSPHRNGYLLYLDLQGPIMMEPEQGSLFDSESNAVSIRKELDDAVEDENAKGVLLHINSPGGTVGMSQELNAAVKRVRAKKPIVVSFGDVAASGGYYTACAADKIVSNPGTLTASIGVIIATLNFKDLMNNKLGVKSYTIKSGKFKDILSPYRDATKDDLALVQHMIDVSYQQFLHEVLDGRVRARELEDDKAKRKAFEDGLRAVADGRIVVGEDAKRIGLVDELGDLPVAHKLLDQMAKERFGLKGKELLPLETPSKSDSWLSSLLSAYLPVKPLQARQPQGVEAFLPMSLRYPNQPLWVME